MALSQIATGVFSPGEPGRYSNLFYSLVNLGDHYQLLADYAAMSIPRMRWTAYISARTNGHAARR